MEKIEIVNGEFETISDGNPIVLVDFSGEKVNSWLRECIVLRESKHAYLLSYESDKGEQESWYFKDKVKIIETIGQVKLSVKWGFIGKAEKIYY